MRKKTRFYVSLFLCRDTGTISTHHTNNLPSFRLRGNDGAVKILSVWTSIQMLR